MQFFKTSGVGFSKFVPVSFSNVLTFGYDQDGCVLAFMDDGMYKIVRDNNGILFSDGENYFLINKNNKIAYSINTDIDFFKDKILKKDFRFQKISNDSLGELRVVLDPKLWSQEDMVGFSYMITIGFDGLANLVGSPLWVMDFELKEIIFRGLSDNIFEWILNLIEESEKELNKKNNNFNRLIN